MKYSFVKIERAFKRRYFVRALRAANMNVSLAAKIAGLNRTHFHNMMRVYKILPGEISARSVYTVRPYRTEHVEFSRRFLLRALKRAEGRPTVAARIAGMNRAYIYVLARRLGVGLRRQAIGRRGNRGNAAWRALADHGERVEADAPSH